ncbi:MAG: hypothetical protein NVS3B20_11620 [Polyangiales bacterium]
MGFFSRTVSKDRPFTLRFSHADDLITLDAERSTGADMTAAFSIIAKSAPPTGYLATKPLLRVAIETTGIGVCGTASGVTISIAGHPEAKVAYASGPSVSYAFVTGVAPGLFTLQAKKNACTATFVHDSFTGRVQLAASAVTLATLRIGDKPI